MRTIRLIRSAPVLCVLALAACGGDGGGEEEGAAPADLIGYYTYSDAVRGASHLALLDQHRFLLIQEPAEAEVPAPAAGEAPGTAAPSAYAGGSEGAVGWYIVRGDSIYLNGERLYARGIVNPEVIRLVFEQPLVPGAGGADYPMPFQKGTASAQPADQQGQGGGSGGSGGEQGGGGGGDGGEQGG